MTRPVAGTALFDLPAGLGQRSESIRWDVLNPDLSLAFTASQVSAASQPSLTFDAASSTNRTIHGVRFGPLDQARVDPLRHRLSPRWVLDDGTEQPIGVFLFASALNRINSSGIVLDADFYDEDVILNQPRESTFSLGPNALISNAIAQIVAEAGLTSRLVVDATVVATTSNAPTSWPAGTTRLKILADLALAAGMYPPYFDNFGALRLRAVPNPIYLAPADLTFSAGAASRIRADSITTATNLITAPNRYLVVGSASASTEIVGYYDVPATAPHSKESRGFLVVKKVDSQAVASSFAAQAAAQAAYATDTNTYDEVRFEIAPDPRLDGFQIWNLLGTNYRAQGFNLTLAPGGDHSVTARKVYTP